jgi:D-beta-D-heptose 7-phosphate kinase/D-beta-D-heptose 1-phosphate adenosyltransferase
MFDYETALEQLAHRTVLCIGDLMLDDFVYGEVSRVSPEAPVPVIAVRREEKVIGGAGNVARNLAGLGARCLFVGVIGADEAAELVTRTIAGFGGAIEPHLVVDATRPTSRKVRFVSEHYSSHLLRADWEVAKPVSGELEARLIERVVAPVPRADDVVLSDYAKGVLTPRLIRTVIDAAARSGKPVVVDPKGPIFDLSRRHRDHAEPQGARESTRMPVATQPEIIAAAAAIRAPPGRAVLVTLSEEGMLLDAEGAEAVHVPAYPVRVRDVSGAGDTVAAVLAVLLATGADFEAATRAANAAASVVVGKRGTATVTVAELRSRILPAAALAAEEKIAFDPDVAVDRVREWRANGCASASPMAASTFSIPAMSMCSPARVPRAIGWWSAQQRCLGQAAQGSRPPYSRRPRPRRRAGGARGGRPRRDLRGRYAARPDPAAQAERPRQGRRLSQGDRGGPRARRGRRRRGDPDRPGARPFHHPHRAALRRQHARRLAPQGTRQELKRRRPDGTEPPMPALDHETLLRRASRSRALARKR